MADLDIPRAPVGLGKAGRRLWKLVQTDAAEQDIALDSLENAYLEDATRLSDRIDELEADLAVSPDGFMVKGVAGQPVAHPLIAEIRQSRAERARMLARIKVSAPAVSESESGGVVLPMGVQQRDAARARWDRAHG
ncbi:hypothetical protein CRM90_22525 [Mycobacterium sp. ENV421]|uniref:hypothetical protein n=1 Tax=Mycobacterium sp. ENV421 TaxID=1213407 RepID=UPI000C9CE5D8|nr:hypothetical protein [Mycobacterium sp. ENV421]PND55529.1 hypothetical protein CRM90_22525 [Mycobacterium sp. ENV421]